MAKKLADVLGQVPGFSCGSGDYPDAGLGCRDFSPSYVLRSLRQGLSPIEARSAYEERVLECLVLAEKGTGPGSSFRKAGCKREAHVMLPRGREGFGKSVPPHPLRPFDEEKSVYRWEENEPRFDARTQPSRTAGTLRDTLAPLIIQVLEEFARVQRAKEAPFIQAAMKDLVILPTLKEWRKSEVEDKTTLRGIARSKRAKNPKLLRAVGSIVTALGGQSVPFTRPPVPTSYALLALLGSPEILQSSDGFEFLFGGVDLRTLRGPARQIQKFLRKTKSSKLREARKRARKRRKAKEEQSKPSTSLGRAIAQARGRRPSPVTGPGELQDIETKVGVRVKEAYFLPKGRGAKKKIDTGRFLSGLDALTDQAAPHWGIALTLAGEGTVTWDLQHSELAKVADRMERPNYNSLQGFTVPELAQVVARKTLSPRTTRKGRSSTPISTKRNPMARRSKQNPRRRRPTGRLAHSEALAERTFREWGPSGVYANLYGRYGARPAVPVNRRNPAPRRKARQLSPAQIAAGFGGKAAKNRQARNNPSMYGEDAIASYRRSHPDESREERRSGRRSEGGNRRRGEGQSRYAGERGSRTRNNPGVGWPRERQWSQVDGAFGADGGGVGIWQAQAPNRRNPSHGGTMIGRFPSPCKVCGQSMKGHPIVQLNGRGPRGGKLMAHASCS